MMENYQTYLKFIKISDLVTIEHKLDSNTIVSNSLGIVINIEDNSIEVYDIRFNINFTFSKSNGTKKYGDRTLTIVNPVQMYQSDIHHLNLPKHTKAQLYYNWIQPVKESPTLYFYFSEIQKSLILQEYHKLPLVFNGKEFIPYTECCLSCSKYEDSYVICKFSKGETYRVIWDDVNETLDKIHTFIV